MWNAPSKAPPTAPLAGDNMPTTTKQLAHLGELRLRAHSRLSQRANANHGGASSTAALGVLHKLASSPDTATNALVLLHEFQVHQVEIDMQSEDLHAALESADAALSRRAQYLNLLPVACFNMDASCCIIETNQTGALWLGLDCESLSGQTLNAFLTPQGSADLSIRMANLVRSPSPSPSWPLDLLADKRPPRAVMAAVSADATPGHYIFVLMNAPPGTSR
jgi:hypothetical protein